MTTCTQWQDIGSPQGGKCTLHNRTQSFGVCRACLDNTSKDWPPSQQYPSTRKDRHKDSQSDKRNRYQALRWMQKAGANFERRLIIFLISQI
jgi:hypothetical protein